MADSNITYTGDGSTTVFSFPFQYLERSHISVALNGNNVNFTFVNNSTIEIAGGFVPANGDVVFIKRTTPREPVVDFRDGETLTESDLDKVAIQALYLAEENTDENASVLAENGQGNLDAAGRRIVQVGDPQNDNDAANKAYVDAQTTNAEQQAQAAAFSAQAASLSALEASNSAVDASDFAQEAEDHLDDFQMIWLGALTTTPTTSIVGAVYWQLPPGAAGFPVNPVGLYIWDGSTWVSAPQGIQGEKGDQGDQGEEGPPGPGVGGDYFSLVNRELNVIDANYPDGSIAFDSSHGFYGKAASSLRSQHELLWSRSNLSVGEGVTVTYDSERAPSIEADTQFLGAAGSTDQAWIDRTSVRASDTEYRNTTQKAILVYIKAASIFSVEWKALDTDAWTVISEDPSGGFSLLVPHGSYYQLNSGASGSGAAERWMELRG